MPSIPLSAVIVLPILLAGCLGGFVGGGPCETERGHVRCTFEGSGGVDRVVGWEHPAQRADIHVDLGSTRDLTVIVRGSTGREVLHRSLETRDAFATTWTTDAAEAGAWELSVQGTYRGGLEVTASPPASTAIQP